MKFHAPENQTHTELPTFAVRHNTLVSPEKVFIKKDYPNLPCDLVKITAQDGRKIYVPRHKLSSAEF